MQIVCKIFPTICAKRMQHFCKGFYKVFYFTYIHTYIHTYSRRQYKVSVTYRSVPVSRPYSLKKKSLARPYRFILLGVTQYYCYTNIGRSQVPCGFFLSVYRCCSFRLFLTRPFRFSPSIVSALLVARSASVRRLFILFSPVSL